MVPLAISRVPGEADVEAIKYLMDVKDRSLCDQLPTAIGLVVQNLDRLVVNRGCLSRAIDRRFLEVGVKLSDVPDSLRPNEPAVQLRFRLDRI
jgi:hypothetical protein